jgi:hypothetical protein
LERLALVAAWPAEAILHLRARDAADPIAPPETVLQASRLDLNGDLTALAQ